jgi:hypothetical protein
MAPVEHKTDTAQADVDYYSRGEFARFFLTFLAIFLVTAVGAFAARDDGLGWLEVLLAIPAVFTGACAVPALAGIVAPGPVNRWL